MGLPWWLRLKNPPTMQKTGVWSLGQEDPLQKGMATHSSILAWKIPWTEKPGRLQSMGSLRVGYNWVTSISLFTFHFHALGKEMATHSSVLAWRIPGTGGAWWAAIYGVAQSRTRLKWLSRPTGKPWQDGFMAITFFFPLKGCLFIYF